MVTMLTHGKYLLDLFIAATALTEGLILVTGNVDHFNRIPGLKIENWMEE